MNTQLEELRKKALKSKNKEKLLFIVPAVLVAIATIASGENFIVGIALGVIIAVMIRIVYLFLSKDNSLELYTTAYKKEMVTGALNGQQIYDNLQFEFEKGFKPEVVVLSGFLEVRAFYSDCYMSASYKGVDFAQADITSFYYWNAVKITNYSGTYFMIPISYQEPAVTLIKNKKADISSILPGSQYRKLSGEFEQLFEVYSTDAAVASLLTPEFMSKLVNIQNKITGRIVLSVKNGWMYIFITKDGSKLKPKLSDELDTSANQAVIEELSRAKYFIDAFSVGQ